MVALIYFAAEGDVCLGDARKNSDNRSKKCEGWVMGARGKCEKTRTYRSRSHAVAAVNGSDNSSNKHGTSDGESCGAGWVVCAGGRGVGGVCV
jgi:hypothetical protein